MEIEGVQSHMRYNSENDQQETETKMMRKKKLVIQNLLYHYQLQLLLSIRHAEGIDDPVGPVRNYAVLYWADHGGQREGILERDRYDPNKEDSYEFLNLELVRVGLKADPGPSSGLVIVGRARVPIPKESWQEVSRRFGLVKFDGDGPTQAGQIALTTELRMFRIQHHPLR